jgi:hypothetical protein
MYRTGFFALVLVACGSSAIAENIIFTIDPNQSSITLTGSETTYGPFEEQSTGSGTAPVDGHFLVSFDPLSATPSTLQFIGGHGYYKVATPYTASPGIGGFGSPAPANVALKTAGNEAFVAVRDWAWDFSSSPISRVGGAFPATATSFTLLGGGMDYNYTVIPPYDSYPTAGSTSFVPFSDSLTGGSWTLSESSLGSGDWTLAFNGHYDFGENRPRGTFTASATSVSTAHFGTANIAAVTATDTHAQALGGATATGGVTADFSQPTSGGTLSVQQLPSNTGLTQTALAAAGTNPIFGVSSADLSVTPQIWNVDYSGTLDGALATLVFHYDPSLLPAGTDQTKLGIWHFSTVTNTWNFGGTVDTLNDTITYVTDSFSPFALGVPEPSTFALGILGALALAAFGRRRRRV